MENYFESMSKKVAFLVVEGFDQENRKNLEKLGFGSQSTVFSNSIKKIYKNSDVDVFYPSDVDIGSVPEFRDIESYDGIVWTGSILNIYDNTDVIKKQIRFMENCLSSNIKMFGSCWGMQVAVSALGGKIRKNPKGPEVGIAHEITLTSEGENHPMYKNKPQTFYAPAFHLDEVETLPKGSVILSYNDMSAVQSISIKSGNAIFWGPQYHPELQYAYLSAVIKARASRLVNSGKFKNEDAAFRFADDVLLKENKKSEEFRIIEFKNWINFIVQQSGGQKLKD